MEVDKEGAAYIPPLSLPAERPRVATTLFGPHPLTYDMFSLLRACAWVRLVMPRDRRQPSLMPLVSGNRSFPL